MKLDIYNHVFPVKFFEKMQDVIPNKGPIKRWLNIPMLYDVDARLKIMERFGEYQQILSLSAPPIEYVAGPDVTPGLATLANDGMAELCKKWPDRFPAFIASLPMNNPKAAVAEIDRAVRDMGAVGIQIFSHVNNKPLDEPEFYPIFERMAQLNRPIWLHPARGANFPDYLTEKKSKYEIWWTFGWP
ncbi:MAG: amidohydrolase family protein, partial [Rhodospirillaceae bacterium]